MSAFQQLHSTYHDVDSGDGLHDNYNNTAVHDLGHKRGDGGRHSDCDGGVMIVASRMVLMLVLVLMLRILALVPAVA